MTTAELACFRCGSTSFEEGFVDDHGQGRIRWFLGQLEMGLFGNAKRMGRLVLALRCTNCSRLELIAGEVS